ncbi:hypothetical protein [Aminobacter aminovorans]|uniref:hypothetical protein n=1 Tax=Aminobacter aminovorans TaxID=83263 RepID=UPI00286462AF|nr:hypothetical protein [Aminobacter aminovorans]MDR7219774.1 hypothetical protein [Aminobacter aminovorans]
MIATATAIERIVKMRNSMRYILLATSIALVGVVPAEAQNETTNQSIDQLLGDHTKYEAVINALQKAVAAHDAAGVAELVSYPIGVSVNGKEMHIRSAKAFAENYDGIFTPSITKAVTDQKYADLFVNYKGIMFGDGQVWINGICHDNACKNFDAKIIGIQDVSK